MYLQGVLWRFRITETRLHALPQDARILRMPYYPAYRRGGEE